MSYKWAAFSLENYIWWCLLNLSSAPLWSSKHLRGVQENGRLKVFLGKPAAVVVFFPFPSPKEESSEYKWKER